LRFGRGPRERSRPLRKKRPEPERPRAEEQLQHSEALLRSIIEHSPIATWISDENGTLVKMNQACRDLLRITDEEVVGKYNVLRDDIVEKQGFMPLVRAVFERGETARFTLDYRTSNLNLLQTRRNVSVVLNVTISPVKNDRGKVTNAVIQHMDITEHRRMEAQWEEAIEALRESEEKYRLLIDTANQSVIVVQDGSLKFANPSALTLLGKDSAREFEDRPFSEFVHPEDRLMVAENFRRLVENEAAQPRYSLRMVTLEGAVKWMETNMALFKWKGRPAVLNVLTDITERKRAEMLHQESRAQYEAIFEATGTATLLVEADTTIIMANRECWGATGYAPEELVGTKWPSYVAPESLETMLKHHQLRREESGKAPRKYEVKLINKEGQIRHVVMDIALIPGTQRSVVSMLDITEHKQAEDALRQTNRELEESRAAAIELSEALKAENETRKQIEQGLRDAETRYRLLFEHSPDGIVILDPKTARPLEFNETACRQLGYTREEFARLSISDLEAIETPEEISSHIFDVLREGRNDFETRHRAKSGEIRDVHVTAQIIEILGHPVYHCVWRDITGRKRAEERLRDSEENMRYIVKHDPNAIAVYDRDLHYIAVSDRYLQDYDVKEEDVIGKHHNDVFPEMPQKWEEVHRRCLAGAIERNDDDFFERPDGSITYNRWECRPWRRVDGSIGGIITYTEVTTERKKAERALRVSEEKYRALFDNATEAIFVVQGGKLVFCNPMTTRLMGYSGEELAAKPFTDFVDPADRDMVIERHSKRLKGEETPGRYVVRLVDRAGNSRWAEINVILIDWEGQSATLNFANDITERKRAEEKLKESEKKYRELYDFLPIPVYEMDLEANIIAANRAIYKAFRGTEEDFKKGFNAWTLLSREDALKSSNNIQRLLRGEEVGGTEYNFQRMDGSVFPAIVISSVIFDRDRPIGLRGAIIDITERRRAEEAVQASLREKETLLREIHHRVKNNMQVISSLFNLQGGFIKDENARRMLKEGQLRIRSMALVHEKLYQSRDLSKIDFANYLRSLSAHLFQFFEVDAGRIRMETDLEDVHLDINSAVPCGLLVSELITNALKHAFPEERKGVIGISLHRREEGMVELRVADDGVGFPEAQDFRRTESLGLQIVNLLVGQLGGAIELDRKNGTSFTIVFPEAGYRATA
jgi:PAS domain S-box-containing protein